MRLRLLIVGLTLFIVLAFSWLIFSLFSGTNQNYLLKTELLRTGQKACLLSLIDKANDGYFLGKDTQTYHLKDLSLQIDTSRLNTWLIKKFENSFQANYSHVGQRKTLWISVRSEKLDDLLKQNKNVKNLYLIETGILALFVLLGILGIYLSIKFYLDLNKQQNNFILSVTHEFKTPIAAVKLLLQTLLRPNLPEDKKEGLVEKAINNTNRLADLAENMLMAMKLEHNSSRDYEAEPINLVYLLENICASIVNVEFINNNLKELYIIGDRMMLNLAFNNLINNGLKYSDQKTVFVEVLKKSDYGIIEFKDQGIGVPKNQQKKIFKKFYRGQDEEVRTSEGTGLGLYIVDQVVKRHNAKIEVTENQPNGTKFTIKFLLSDNS